MSAQENKLYKLILSSMFLALALILPFLTGQIQTIGKMLCPMHIPVLLCGFICGPMYGLSVGLIAPILRFFLFEAPVLIPTGLAMCFELAAYGFFCGLLFNRLPHRPGYVYFSQIASMIAGRIVWGIVMTVLMGLGIAKFSMSIFIASAILNAIPGIIVQILLIPPIIISLARIGLVK